MQPINLASVLIFDLDGTILEVNSFPLWVHYLMIGKLSGIGLHRRLLLSLRTLRLLLSRKLGRLNHDELQRRLQVAWRSAVGPRSAVLEDHFGSTLLQRVRRNLRPLLEAVTAEGLDAVLATAAAADYAESFGRRIGFQHVLATPPGRAIGAPSNSGAQKRRQVLDLLHELDWRDRKLVLFTDHVDDLPLIRECSAIYWFGPPDVFVAAGVSSGGARVVYCRDLPGEVVQATLREITAR
jgi:phosphoserine phosphatase